MFVLRGSAVNPLWVWLALFGGWPVTDSHDVWSPAGAVDIYLHVLGACMCLLAVLTRGNES